MPPQGVLKSTAVAQARCGELNPQDAQRNEGGKMNFDEVDNIVCTAVQAMRQGRIGFSVQQVNCVNDHHEVLYSECLARLLKFDGSVTDQVGGRTPERHAAVFAPLAMQVRDRRTIDDDLADAQTDGFRHAGAGVIHHAEQRAIPLTRPGPRIRCVKDRLHLLA